MDIATLKGGARVPVATIRSTTAGLRMLLGENLMAFLKLLDVCREPQKHQLDERLAATLRPYGLVQQSLVVHDDVRAVVCAAVAGEDMEDIAIGDPVAGAPA